MNKPSNPAAVNSSSSLFYGFYTLLYTFLITRAFGADENYNFISIIGFAALLYFIWYLINQLYSPGQIYFLYFFAFLGLPVAMSYMTGYSFGHFAAAIFVIAILSSLLTEAIYEKFISKHLPRSLKMFLKSVDAKLDLGFLRYSRQHIYNPPYRGLLIGVGLVCIYFIGSYILLHR